MRGFVAVLRREIAARRLAFAAGAALSVIPFAVPLARGLTGLTAREARETTALLLATGLAAVLSAALGWSALSRDLAERRLGFDFSRPLSASSIWAGRMAGAFLVAVGAAAVAWLPSLIASRGRSALADLMEAYNFLPVWAPGVLIAAPAVLILLFHVAGIALRSHSALLLLDALILSGAAAVTIAITRRLLRVLALNPAHYGLAGLAAIVVIGFLAAGLAAIVRGRTDIRSAHRASSPWLWTALAVGVSAYGLYSSWVLSASVTDLALWSASAAPRGQWIAVDGAARGAPAVFLIDSSTGTSFRTSSPDQPLAFSADGKHAAWFEAEGNPAPYALTTAVLGADPLTPRRTTVRVGAPQDLVLSEDGSRVAVLSHGNLSILDTGSGRSLGSARLSESDVSMAGSFLTSGLFRAYLWRSTRLEILEFDAPTRRLSRTGAIDNLQAAYFFCVDSTKERLLVRESSGGRVRLFDARTGALLATVAEEKPHNSGWASFLADGRIVVATADNSGAPRLRIFSADASPGVSIELPRAPIVRLGGEVAPGKLAVMTRETYSYWRDGTLYLADLDAGTFRKVSDHLSPILWYPRWSEEAPEGSDATKLFYGPRQSLVLVDPLTGQRREILEGRRRD